MREEKDLLAHDDFYYEIGRIHARFEVLEIKLESLTELIIKGKVEE